MLIYKPKKPLKALSKKPRRHQSKVDNSLQSEGFANYFTYRPEKKMDFVAMRLARRINQHVSFASDPAAMNQIKTSYMPGPMHYANHNFTKQSTHVYYDLDMELAYPNWLLDYAEGKFDYEVGGTKRYHSANNYFNKKDKSESKLLMYRLAFAVKHPDVYETDFYKHWFTKTFRITNVHYTNEMLAGRILIPNIEDLPNRFINDVKSFEVHEIKVDSIVETKDKSHIYINKKNIRASIELRHSTQSPALAKKHRAMLVMSTGYLAIADKTFYYSMVNHVRWYILRAQEIIKEFNDLQDDPNYHIKVVAVNTDGMTLYAHEDLKKVINSLVNTRINPILRTTFRIKNIYDHAIVTPHDIRKGVIELEDTESSEIKS